MINRRRALLGAPAALGAASANAAPDKPFFVAGPMASNPLAVAFRTPAAPLTLPRTPLLSSNGPTALSQLRGRAYLVSLWAEWCAPCLLEAGDLAEIGRTLGGPSFGVVFVLTGSKKKLEVGGAQDLLAAHGAGQAHLLVEADGGSTIMQALATQGDGGKGVMGLPCNLLVDRHGRIRARSFGATTRVISYNSQGPVPEAPETKVPAGHSLWASQAGRDFAAALAAGLLEKI